MAEMPRGHNTVDDDGVTAGRDDLNSRCGASSPAEPAGTSVCCSLSMWVTRSPFGRVSRDHLPPRSSDRPRAPACSIARWGSAYHSGIRAGLGNLGSVDPHVLVFSAIVAPGSGSRRGARFPGFYRNGPRHPPCALLLHQAVMLAVSSPRFLFRGFMLNLAAEMPAHAAIVFQ